MNFIKMNTIRLALHKIGKMKKMREVPWYLVVGASGCGKTSLLKSIDPHLFDPHFNIVSDQHPNQSLNFWLSKEAVFIEANLNNEWKKVFKNFNGIRIAGIILLIDITTLQTNTLPDFNALISSIKHYLPIYLILSKLDRISGFVAFNNDASQEEREQLFGFCFEQPTTIQKFDKQFNQWITKINEQLIWRLRQEHEFINRAAIKDFPIHIQRLKPDLFKIVRQLQGNHKLHVQSLYFTSAMSEATLPFAKPHFIRTFSQQLYEYQRTQHKKSQFKPYTQIAFAICILTLGLITSGWLISYQFNKHEITTIQAMINHTQPNNASFSNLYSMNQLKTAMTELKSEQHWYNQLGLQQSEKLNKMLQQRYQKIVQESYYQKQPENCKTISECLVTINNLINAPNKPTSTINQALINLRQQLEPLVNNSKSAFILASQRMQNRTNTDAIDQLLQIAKTAQGPWQN